MLLVFKLDWFWHDGLETVFILFLGIFSNSYYWDKRCRKSMWMQKMHLSVSAPLFLGYHLKL